MNGNDKGVTTADLAAAPPRNEPAPPSPAVRPATDEDRIAMFSHDEVDSLRPTWTDIQTRFIDEPRKSVVEADKLVASTVQRLAESFAEQRAKLEAQWSKGDEVSTEDLRLALRRYRSFFDRLLSL